MIKNKLVWIMSSVATLLVVAVTFVYFFHTDNKSGSADFLSVAKDAAEINTKVDENVALAELEQVQLDTISDRFSEHYNRSVSSLPMDLDIDLNDISGIPGDVNLKEKTIKRSTETIEVPFESIEYYTDLLAPGQSEVTVAGVNGVVNVVYEEIYYNGLLDEKIEIDRELVSNSISQEIAIGAEITPSTSIDEYTEEVMPSGTTSKPEQTPAPTEAPLPTETTPPTEAPPTPTAPPAGQSIQFVSPGSNSAAATNHSKIAGLMKVNGKASYYDYSDNGNGTITVDGYTFAYTSTNNSTITGYDGIESSATGIPNKTASGLSTTRGLAATVFPQFGGYPFGSVLFVEGYGLVVVADYNGMGRYDSSLIDVCYYDGELAAGINPGKMTSKVYVLATQ